MLKQKIESIDGTINVTSELNVGTTFAIEIPLSLAVLKALFSRVQNKIYAIPVMNIERLVFASKENLQSMLNYEALILDGEKISPLYA